MEDYQLLLSEKTLKSLCKTSDVEKKTGRNLKSIVSSLLTELVAGEWRNDPSSFLNIWDGSDISLQELNLWVDKNTGVILHSAEVVSDVFAVWEIKWTFDISHMLTQAYIDDDSYDYKSYVKKHVILHRFGRFPGNLEALLKINNNSYEKLDFKDYVISATPPSEEDCETHEAFHILPKTMVDSVLEGKQQKLLLHLTSKQARVIRRKRGPVLLSGEAGSGKTSAIVHWFFTNLNETPNGNCSLLFQGT